MQWSRSFIPAAAKVLERTNGESLTGQVVADEADRSLRTLYQYFTSKDDLLLAVFEEAMRTYARIIRAAVADLDDPLERLACASSRRPTCRRCTTRRGSTAGSCTCASSSARPIPTSWHVPRRRWCRCTAS
jgi:DNA-binding transcriptional regulator YbjK